MVNKPDSLEVLITTSNCPSLKSLEFPGYIEEPLEENPVSKSKGKLSVSADFFGPQFKAKDTIGSLVNSNRDAILGMFCKSGSEQRGLIELRKAFNVEPFQLDIYPNNCNEFGQSNEMRRVADHPITGNTIPTYNLLIKVKKRRRKNATKKAANVADNPEDDEKLEASLVGLVNKTCRFRSLADFQVEMPNDDDVANLMTGLINLDVEKMKEFHFRPNVSIPETTTSLVYPSPSYCRLDIPFDYGYKENPNLSTVIQKDPNTGEDIIQVVSRFKSKRMEQTQVVQESDKVYPSGPPAKLPNLDENPNDKPGIFTGDTIGRIKSLVDRLKKCFLERPICTRLYLSNQLKVHYMDDKALFKALQYVAYLIPFGPWRGCWVVYGVDPRSDSKYRIYQTLDMRSVNSQRSKALKKIIKAKEVKKLLETESFVDGATHIFDGEHYTPARTFQLIDLVYPELKALVNSVVYCRAEYHPKEGFYLDGHLGILREKAKKLINQIKSARLERITKSKGDGSINNVSSSDDEEDDEIENNNTTQTMLSNFFDQLGDDEFDILEEDD